VIGRSREWARNKFHAGDLEGVESPAGSSTRIRVYETSAQQMRQVLSAQSSGLSSADLRIAELVSRLEEVERQAAADALLHTERITELRHELTQASETAVELHTIVRDQKEEIVFLRRQVDERRARSVERRGSS